MPPVIFRFAAFERDLLQPPLPLFDNPTVEDGIATSHVLSFSPVERNGLALHLTKQSPPELERIRPLLETRVYASPDLSHDSFDVFNVVHDDAGYIDAYPMSAGGAADSNENETVRQWYAKAVRFFAYELNGERGHIYATTTEAVLKEMFRRHRAAKNDGAVFRRRVVDIRGLESTLRSEMGAEANKYSLKNVRSDTAITGIIADGQQLSANGEVQGIKNRAEKIWEIRFDYQYGNDVLRISIYENGVVRFSNNPGDRSALDLLHRLHTYIDAHSELAVVTVR